jgi:hypothetical protein
MKPVPVPALRIICPFILFFALTVTASAQIESMATQAPWLQFFFSKMSPNTPEFSAIGQFDAYDPSGKSLFEMPMDIAKSTNCFLWKSDISKFWIVPQQARTQAQLMRTDKFVILVKMEQRKIYVLFPGIRAYVATPNPCVRTG